MEDLLNEVLEKENIVNDPEEALEVEESINEFKREEIKLNEGKQDNFTDVSILNSNAVSGLRSSTSYNINGYNSTILWENSRPNSAISGSSFTIPYDDFSDCDLIGVYFKYSNYDNTSTLLLFTKDEFYNSNNNNGYGYVTSYDGDHFCRAFWYQQSIGRFMFNDNKRVGNTGTQNSYGIPLFLIGYKKQEVIIPEPTPTPDEPTTSGNGIVNNITNNYYCTVSDDSLSYNMLNKPLNKYTTGESYIAFGTLMFLGIGLYLIIRRSIFKWH